MAECDPKELKRLERERKKAEKQREKEFDRAVKKAAAVTKKECRAGERVKQLVVILGAQLITDGDMMTGLVPRLSELDVKYRSFDESGGPASGTSYDSGDSTVLWVRRLTERTVDDNAQIIESTSEVVESHVLIVLNGHTFLDLVRRTKQSNHRGVPLDPGINTLTQEVELIQSIYKNQKLVLGIYKLDGAMRDQRTQKNRRLRAAVRDGSHVQPVENEVSRLDCEQVMVELQMKHGITCCVRMCQKPENLADLIITLTKSIAEVPFKKENPFTFFSDLGPGPSKRALQESSNKISLVWQTQLMQISGVSHPVASAIAGAYPSPAHLLRAYDQSSSIEQAQHLLEDIQIRRGTGVTSTTRRVGSVLSTKIHSFLTTTDKDALLT